MSFLFASSSVVKLTATMDGCFSGRLWQVFTRGSHTDRWEYLKSGRSPNNPNLLEDTSAALRLFVSPSFLGNRGVFTAFQTLESFQSSDALKGQKASKCAPDLPSWKRYMDRGGKSQATIQKALMQRTVGSLPNLTFSTGGLQLPPNRLLPRLPMSTSNKVLSVFTRIHLVA